MKKITLLLICTALSLAACQGQAASPQPTPTETARPSFTPTIQARQADATPTQAAVPPGCTVISPRPTPGPTETSLFPPVNSDDWVKGPEDASVTLIEYSDFQ